MRVRLTKKLAREVDGVDLTNCDVGDVIELPPGKARVLIAEQWAIAERRNASPHRLLAFRRTSDPGAFRHLEDDDVSQAS